jgi:hypothetical protein
MALTVDIVPFSGWGTTNAMGPNASWLGRTLVLLKKRVALASEILSFKIVVC